MSSNRRAFDRVLGFGGCESVRLGFLAAEGGELRGEVAAIATVVVVVVGCLLGLVVVVVHVDVGSGVVVIIFFVLFVRVLIVDVFFVFIGPVVVLGRFALHPREVIRVQALHAIVLVFLVVVVFRVFFCVWVLGAGPGFLHRLA